MAQLHDTYRQDKAEALLSGLVQTFVLRVGDAPSVEYVRGQLGREQERRTVPTHAPRRRSIGRQELQDETYPVAESEMTWLADGEAFVITPRGWIRGQIAQLSRVRQQLNRALNTVQ